MGVFDFINFLIAAPFEPPTSYLILGLLAMVGGIFLMKFIYKQQDQYQQREAKDIVYNNIYRLTKALGKDIQAYLRKDLQKIGRIIKHYKRDVQYTVDTEDGKETKKKTYRIFFAYPPGIVNDILHFLGASRFVMKVFIIPSDAVWASDQVNISDEVQFHEIGGVFVADEKPAHKLLEEMALKEQNEELLTVIPEYARKQNYIDSRFAKKIQGREKDFELNQEGFDRMRKAEAENV